MTVDWKNSDRVLADYVNLIRFLHILGGVYIWELVTNLDFEYSFLTGKRKLTWTFPLYLGCRWSTLSLIIVQFLGLDTSHEFNCQELVFMTFIFAYLSLMFASALTALRVIALWEHNRIIVAVTFTSWIANVVIYIYNTVTSHGHWTGSECVIQDTSHSGISIYFTLARDLLLLILMLVGLLRWKEAFRSDGICRFMYTQGLVWVLVVVLAEVPPAVFTDLDLNDPMNLMFQALGLTIMSLGAPRIYRGLVDYPCSDSPSCNAAGFRWWVRVPQRSSFGSSQQNDIGEWTGGVRGPLAYHSLSSGTV